MTLHTTTQYGTWTVHFLSLRVCDHCLGRCMESQHYAMPLGTSPKLVSERESGGGRLASSGSHNRKVGVSRTMLRKEEGATFTGVGSPIHFWWLFGCVCQNL